MNTQMVKIMVVGSLILCSNPVRAGDISSVTYESLSKKIAAAADSARLQVAAVEVEQAYMQLNPDASPTRSILAQWKGQAEDVNSSDAKFGRAETSKSQNENLNADRIDYSFSVSESESETNQYQLKDQKTVADIRAELQKISQHASRRLVAHLQKKSNAQNAEIEALRIKNHIAQTARGAATENIFSNVHRAYFVNSNKLVQNDNGISR